MSTIIANITVRAHGWQDRRIHTAEVNTTTFFSRVDVQSVKDIDVSPISQDSLLGLNDDSVEYPRWEYRPQAKRLGLIVTSYRVYTLTTAKSRINTDFNAVLQFYMKRKSQSHTDTSPLLPCCVYRPHLFDYCNIDERERERMHPAHNVSRSFFFKSTPYKGTTNNLNNETNEYGKRHFKPTHSHIRALLRE